MTDALKNMANPKEGIAALWFPQTRSLRFGKAVNLFDVDNPENIVFTLNATHALTRDKVLKAAVTRWRERA